MTDSPYHNPALERNERERASLSPDELQLARALQSLAFVNAKEDPEHLEKAAPDRPSPLYIAQTYALLNDPEAEANFFALLRDLFPERFV